LLAFDVRVTVGCGAGIPLDAHLVARGVASGFVVEMEQAATTVTVTAKLRDRLSAATGVIAAPIVKIAATMTNMLRNARIELLNPPRNH
jgi:hypothetical protein